MNAAPLSSKPHWRDAAALNKAATQLGLDVRRTAAMSLNRSSWSPSSSMGSCCKRDNHRLSTALSWSRRYPGAVLIAFKPPCSSSSTDTSFRGSPSSAHSERAGLDGDGAPRPRCSSSSGSSKAQRSSTHFSLLQIAMRCWWQQAAPARDDQWAPGYKAALRRPRALLPPCRTISQSIGRRRGLAGEDQSVMHAVAQNGQNAVRPAEKPSRNNRVKVRLSSALFAGPQPENT